MGTMNYAKYSEKRKAFVFDMVFPNTYGKIVKLLSAMNEAKVKPEELEVLRPHRTYARSLAARRSGRARAAAAVLVHRERPRRAAPDGREPAAPAPDRAAGGARQRGVGVYRDQPRVPVADARLSALVLGGNVRVGLEDNLYLPGGQMAKSNGDLVEVAARMVRDVGRKVATVDEARTILGLGAAA